MSHEQDHPLSETEQAELAVRLTFAEDVRAYRKAMRRWVGIVLTGVFCILIAFGFLVEWLDLKDAPPRSLLQIVVPGSAFVSLLGALQWLGTLMDQHLRRLRCPRCGTSFRSGVQLDLAVLTGRCDACREEQVAQILSVTRTEEESFQNASAIPTSLDEIVPLRISPAEIMSVPKTDRRDRRRLLVWVGVGLGVAFCGSLLGHLTYRRLNSRGQEILAPLMLPLFMAPGIILTLSTGIWDSRRLERQRATVRCPHCHAQLGADKLAVLTGNCPVCGCGLFVVSPSCLHLLEGIRYDGSLIPMAAFRRHCKIITSVMVGFLLTMAAPLALFAISQNILFKEQDALKQPIHLGWGVILLLIVSALLIRSIVWVESHLESKLRCPSCRRKLYSRRQRLIIATRRCPECLERVIDEPEPKVGR